MQVLHKYSHASKILPMDQFARRISSVKKIINAKNRSLDIGHSDKKHHEGKLFYHLFLNMKLCFLYVHLMNNNNACLISVLN